MYLADQLRNWIDLISEAILMTEDAAEDLLGKYNMRTSETLNAMSELISDFKTKANYKAVKATQRGESFGTKISQYSVFRREILMTVKMRDLVAKNMPGFDASAIPKKQKATEPEMAIVEVRIETYYENNKVIVSDIRFDPKDNDASYMLASYIGKALELVKRDAKDFEVEINVSPKDDVYFAKFIYFLSPRAKRGVKEPEAEYASRYANLPVEAVAKEFVKLPKNHPSKKEAYSYVDDPAILDNAIKKIAGGYNYPGPNLITVLTDVLQAGDRTSDIQEQDFKAMIANSLKKKKAMKEIDI